MGGEAEPDFGPLVSALGESGAAGFAYVGRVADVRIYRNLANARELALDDRGRAHDLYAGGYWPVSRGAAIRYALGETDERAQA